MNDRIAQDLTRFFDRHPKLGAALKKIAGLDAKED